MNDIFNASNVFNFQTTWFYQKVIKKAVFVTPHYLDQKRRTGFYWAANALHEMGWQVLFFTSPISMISRLNRDHRIQYGALSEKHKLIEKRPNFFSYVHYTTWHKVNFSKAFPKKWLGNVAQKVLYPLMKTPTLMLGESAKFIREADVIVFESSPSLELMTQFQAHNSHARYIYRASDDLDVLRVHQDTKDFQAKNMLNFDRVSCVSIKLYEKLKTIAPKANIHLDYHGIEKNIFDEKHPNPYKQNGNKNAVFVGVGDVDYDFFEKAADICPNWNFHFIGPLKTISKANVIMYGEIPFIETIPYIQHADAGLNCRVWSPGGDAFTDTLKVMQFTYCGIAIVAPEFLRTERKNTFYYLPGDQDSMKVALDQASEYKREDDGMDYQINSWQDVVESWIAV